LDNEAVFAVVGSESLLGREIRDLATTFVPHLRLKLIAADDEKAGMLTRLGDEPAVVGDLTAHSLADTRAVILAGSPESSRKALEMEPAAAIDLTFTAEDRPEARIRAPLVEDDSEEDGAEAEPASIHVIAHPAAIALALFLRRLHEKEPIQRAVVQLFAPASEHGTKGVTELQDQTVSLLSFKSRPQAVFDAQASFNLLARYGEEAPASLEDSELRIERHLTTLLGLPGAGTGAPLPSLRLIQAPVFHGYTISAWVEFEENPELEAIESALSGRSIEVRGEAFDPPTNVGQAGQGGIAVGAIAPDRNEPSAWWFWIVADNLRLAAENAIEVARQLL
jgi:aspartate-semialdehyde dehydrogenase